MLLKSLLHSAFCILCPLFLSGVSFAQQKSVDTAPANMKLVWSDEFDGVSLNYSKWGVQENAFGGGNSELQIFTDRTKNVRVENGHLILEAHRDNGNISGTVREYSSGRVRTKHQRKSRRCAHGLVAIRQVKPHPARRQRIHRRRDRVPVAVATHRRLEVVHQQQ